MRIVRFFAPLVALALVAGCAAQASDDDASATSEDALRSPLALSDMKPVARPAGMPAAWAQPDSTGVFDEHGKCGATAVSNLLRLYGTELSPDDADADGVRWWIGTRGISIRDWLDDHHPELGCTLEHPTDGPGFLHEHLAAGQPVLVWFNAEGGLSSHWVTAVGTVGTGDTERVVVMSWGRYYAISMAKLDAAWKNVYFIRRPSIVCTAKTKLLHGAQ